MKTLSMFVAGVLVGAGAGVRAQPAGVEAGSDYAVTARAAHSRVWSRTVWEPTPYGRPVPHIQSYTECATGLHYWANGQWRDSLEIVEPVPGGAVARHGQHRVIFSENLAADGAIDMETADGKRLRSNVLGLRYFDPATGQAALIAEVRDGVGKVIPPNFVLYEGAFTGVRATVRYTYTKAGLEQDILLLERPAVTPESLGFDPQTVLLQVVTEFLSSPEPAREASIDYNDPKGTKPGTKPR